MLALLALPFLFPAIASAEVPTKRVLVITSYDISRPAVVIVIQAIVKEPTFWEHYKWYIVGVVAAFILEALLIAWLLVVQRRRKRAERDSEHYEGLAEDEHRRLDEIVSNVPGIVWELLIDPDTNTLKTTFISDYVEKMLGYTPEEWLATPSGFVLSIMTEEDRERVTRDCKAVISTGKGAVTRFHWKAKDGRLLWVESHLSPIVDANGKTVGLRGVSIDITEKMLAEDAQRQSEERNRAILRALPDLIFLHTRDGIYLDCHAKDLQDLLVSPEEIIGKNIRDVLPPELAERVLNCFQLADETGEPQVVEYELALDKKERWFEARIVRTGENILSVVRDITERKQAEEALRESEEKYRTLFESIDEGFAVFEMIYDDVGRAVDYVFRVTNPAFERHTGWRNVVGRRLREFNPDPEDYWLENYARVAATGESARFTNRAAAVNRWYEVYAFRLGEAGSHTVAVIFSEVSERIRAEEALRRSQAVLAQAGQMASLGAWEVDLSYSDDINENPLAWSDEVYRIYGYEPGAVKVSSGLFFRHVHPDDRQRIHEEIQAALDGRRLYQLEHRIIRADGAERVVQEHAVFDVDEAGRPHRIIGAVQDITERKAADEAIRRSEAVLAQAGQMASLGAWEADLAHSDDIIEVPVVWSDEVYRIFGYEPGSVEVSSGLFYHHVHPDDRQHVLEALRAALAEGRSYNLEYRIVRADGVERVVQAHADVEVDEAGRPRRMIGAVQDITERKAADEALRQSEGRLRRAQQAARVGTWEWDVRTGASVWSEMIWQLFGLEPDDCATTLERFLEFIHPEDRDPVMRKVNGVIAEGEDYYNEFRIVRRDGGVIWVSSSGRLIRSSSGEPERFIGVNMDITERKVAEEALRQSEERFRNMADTAPVLIWMADTDKLCYYFNKQWLDFTGRSPEQELGYGWAQGVHPDDYARCLEIYNAGFDHREPFKLEYRLRRADGEYRWVFDTGTPRLSSGGEFLGYIGSCVDIHDRKESEEALHRVMEEVNRLKNQLEEENIYLQEEINLEHNLSEIVGHSDAIRYVLRKIEQVAPTDATVLITGETGTGKELIARAIHSESLRRNRPLVKVNCAALSASLIESELFGHEKGSFTGAHGRKIGRFELADGATLFLDEIGELPLELQVKLLRVIQEGELERLGSNRTIKVDVRIIAATNRHLLEEVQKGRFREDLWYRLNVFPITMPPLRQRMEDIGLLVEHLINRFSKKIGKKITSIAPATLSVLQNYSWPGNVRELANVIERAVINNGGSVLRIPNISEASHREAPSTSNRTLEEVEREYIITVLGETGWKIEGPRGAAVILGLHPSTLRTRMAKLGIQKPHQDFVSSPSFTSP